MVPTPSGFGIYFYIYFDMDYKQIKDFVPEFWEGKTNILVRGWTYLNRGLDVFNQLKYVGAGVIALYVLLKLTEPIWIGIMFVVSLPILTIIGRWHLFKASKTQEFVTTVKGSVIGYNNYNLQVLQVELLEKILSKLENGKNTINRI